MTKYRFKEGSGCQKIQVFADGLFPLRKGKITPKIRQEIVNDFFVKTSLSCECLRNRKFIWGVSVFSLFPF